MAGEIPLMIVGDGPQEPTGLGRIARDLVGQISTATLPVNLVQVGGGVPPVWPAWRHYPLDRSAGDWGASYVEAMWQSCFGTQPGILWVIWDPGRFAAFRDIRIPVQRWVYPAIDSTNIRGSIGGPARAALESADRVIAYGRWAAEILKTVRGPTAYLPHGIVTQVYAAPLEPEEVDWLAQTLGPYHTAAHHTLIGCVATNQPRKDLGLYFHTLAELRDRGVNVYGWLHIDTLVKDWSIVQLVEDFGLSRRITVTTPPMTDRQLAALYQICDVTIAPGLGEGFGYPIVESLASGTPVVHGDFGGGLELVPKIEWRFPVREIRLESVYALRRPVFRADDVANAIERVLSWQHSIGEGTAAAYCRGAVAHLDWQMLWPRWEAWIRRGLEGR
jgi:glycosyltransferase involved in cell wall biosynthesis